MGADEDSGKQAQQHQAWVGLDRDDLYTYPKVLYVDKIGLKS